MVEDEGKRNDEVTRGNQAKVLLNDELYQEAFTTVRATYMDAWDKTALAESQKREHIWMMVATIDDVRKHIETVMVTGEFAQEQLDNIVPEEYSDETAYKKRLKKWGLRI
jgi:hypothetical protein